MFSTHAHSRLRLSMVGLFSGLVLTLAACAPTTSEKLADDPTQEPVATAPDDGGRRLAPPAFDEPADSETPPDKYAHLDPEHVVPTVLLQAAVAYFDTNLERIKNRNVLTIIDFAQPSNKPRMFIINMETGVVWAIHVAHGKGSDSNHDGVAEKFSNVSGSNASSLGFYLTAETYNGAHGLSLRLDGLSSTNSNVRPRAVVVHGASYVQERDVIQGRSWGCPAVSMANRDRVVELIKKGSLIYAGLSY